MNKRRTGAEKEQVAKRYLEAKGLRILEQNYHSRQGEIDLICKQEDFYVFVEVKYRSTEEKGHALEAVSYRKQRQICRVADVYRYKHGLQEGTCIRYDVVAIQEDEVIWVQNAFEHIYTRDY